MAKKTAPKPKPQLVHIPSFSADNPRLSKAQKEFNRLTKRIAQLEKDVQEFREAATRLRQRVQNEYRPLQAEHNGVRADLVRLFDQALGTYKLTKTERNKILDLLLNACADLLDRGHADLQPIFDKYAPPPASEEEEADADRQTSEAMKQLFTLRYGIEFDPAVDVSTKEKFRAYVDQKMAEQHAADAEEEARDAQRRANRKKSPKQQAAEAKKQAEEKNITKSVRALYLDLVKVLHPDREPDEAEKARKTGLLQQVTAAYEANELLTLLRLQLELQRIDQSHLENLAEDQLRYYNQLLREQVRDLDDALYGEQVDLSRFTGQPYYALASPAALEYDFQRQTAQLQAKIKQLAAEVLAFEHDPAALKAWLKVYKIPKGPGLVMVQI
ncbi:hypothetical protein [Hymenobacter sp. PAMC 26628]|uniref:hypothetical protein n=1 Tax=Hymenobacter sp. PAMC 26628 TaxID=1484118 RepID=UPI0007702182|nr:hypothetical protein [Hymenobacter sp. PAMC 26628]AMJ66836.1 hypothetical protein AXW84_16425 [Hymenobacter sp. PAMC 26628]